MKHKVKKFGRGGDILTGLGAGLLGYAAYKKLSEGKDKDDDYTRRVKEYGTKGKFPEEKPEEKATESKSVDDAAKRRATAASKGQPDKGDATNDDIVTKKVKPGGGGVNKNKAKGAPITASNTSTDSTTSSGSSSDDVIGAGIRNARIGEKSKPFPSNSPAVKAAEQQKFLRSKAGLSGKGITTPGDAKKTEPTSKAGVVFGGSTVRSDKDKMSENARRVQKQREEAEKSRYKKGGAVKKYAAGGTTTSKPEPKKAPMPDFAREAKENRERDQRVKKEREAYDKYDKTRLKDQGGFKKGGMTASKRADGIAIRGKTRA